MKLRSENMFCCAIVGGKTLLGLLAFGAAVLTLPAVPNESRRAVAVPLEERALNFESNYGQYGPATAFVSRGPNYHLALSPTQVRVTLRKAASDHAQANPFQVQRAPGSVNYRSLLIELPGANPQAVMSGEGEVSGRANYFIGNDPAQWQTGVPTFHRVRVADVYPGINLVHYGNAHHLEYDFEIAPNADPAAIALRFIGADKISISAEGDLILTLGQEEIRQPKPVIYQTVNGRRQTIAGGYVLVEPQTVKFTLGEYDRRRPLVIDPVVSYANYIVGASGVNDDCVWAVATGADGSVYMAGETLTAGSATTNAYQTNLAGVLAQHGDVFVTRQDNQAHSKVYFTYLGGNSYESAFGLAVDADGNAYVTGYTGSTNFPTSRPVQAKIAGQAPAGFVSPPVDCFVAKIGPYGSNLLFSTYFGGSGSGLNGVGDDVGFGIALDGSRNVYVAGYTTATNFPTANTTFTNASGAEDGFVLKLDASGTNVIYAMLLGGTNSDVARDIAVDLAGNPIVIGYTSSTNFPLTTNALQTLLNRTTNTSSASDVFVSQLGTGSGTLTYSTFLGGTNSEQGIRLATDTSGAAFVTGWTKSGDFPRTATNFPSAVVSNTSAADVFVVKLTPGQTNLDYSITFGGTGKDEGWDVAVDAAGRAHVVGITESVNFPTNALFNGLLGTLSGTVDAFVAVINNAGNAFDYSGYFGDDLTTTAYGVALDGGGNSYTVGETTSSSRITGKDGFILKILAETTPVTLGITPAGTNVLLSWPGYAPEFALESRTNVLGSNAWTTVPTARVLTNNSFVVTVPATNAGNFYRLKR